MANKPGARADEPSTGRAPQGETVEPMTLDGIVADLRRQGFAADLEARADGLAVSGGDRTYRPEELAILAHHRLEGVSDPDDLAVVYAIEAADGTRGVLVDGYGAYADPAVGEILRRVVVREGSAGPGAPS